MARAPSSTVEHRTLNPEVGRFNSSRGAPRGGGMVLCRTILGACRRGRVRNWLDRGWLLPLLDIAPQLLPSPQTAFGVDVAQVILNRLAADEQLGRDLRIGHPLPD